MKVLYRLTWNVILSGAGTSRSEVLAESKDPYKSDIPSEASRHSPHGVRESHFTLENPFTTMKARGGCPTAMFTSWYWYPPPPGLLES